MYNYGEIGKMRGRIFMQPRIFISSTFYDLKYIREELSNYVRIHDFEPIMFEDGDIGYTPGKKLDDSCYDAMRNADMVILIVGGEYGSPAGEDNKKEFEEYISVTRKEFRTAVENGIPVFCMLDMNVSAEYGVYDINSDEIENGNHRIKFKATKNINVFRFIKEIRGIGNIPVQEFRNVSEIKDFLGKQWADMFKNYLNSLRCEIENKKIENSVNEMKELIQKMNIMLDSVGKNILTKDNPDNYESVINQQDILSFCRIISDSFKMVLGDKHSAYNNEKRKNIIKEFLNILKSTHEEDMWNKLLFPQNDNLVKIFGLFEKSDFEIIEIDDEYLNRIGDKYKLLYDNDNMEKIADTMIKDEYFNILIGK